MVSVSSMPFDRTNRGTPFNASGVVAVGDRRFVFIDNDDPGALFELTLTRDGRQHGPVVRRRIVGVAPGKLSDPEGLTRIDTTGRAIDLVVSSSFCVLSPRRSEPITAKGLVRIRYSPLGDLHGQAMPRFRRWLLDAFPTLVPATQLMPDDGGLNIEGLAWDPVHRELLFGVRSPVANGRIPVLSVALDLDAPWTTDACREPRIRWLQKSDQSGPQGIRDIEYDAEADRFILIVGRSLSAGEVPFELLAWDGTSETADILDVTFKHRSMKPEGVTTFWDGEVRRMLIVDDSGGFAALDSPL
ncbi:DUF3616 domain-containing protein [Gordonia sp. NPDC003424]